MLLCANLADPAPTDVARNRGSAVVATIGLSTGRGPLRATRGCGPAATAGLCWRCDPNSSASGQRQTTCS
jgi:hypothetical protein